MNIIEAIKSGKRFKRPSWPKFVLAADIIDPLDGCYEITHDSLLADDWEVEETPVQITISAFNLAWDRASYAADVRLGAGVNSAAWEHLDVMYQVLTKELGL